MAALVGLFAMHGLAGHGTAHQTHADAPMLMASAAGPDTSMTTHLGAHEAPLAGTPGRHDADLDSGLLGVAGLCLAVLLIAAVVAAARAPIPRSALLVGLTACGDDSPSGDAQAAETAPNGAVFNDADVDFATGMIPHHAQALVMVDLTRGRDLSPEVQKLADDIQAAQGPEIEQLVDWLPYWKPQPSTVHSHRSAADALRAEADLDIPRPTGVCSTSAPGQA